MSKQETKKYGPMSEDDLLDIEGQDCYMMAEDITDAVYGKTLDIEDFRAKIESVLCRWSKQQRS